MFICFFQQLFYYYTSFCKVNIDLSIEGKQKIQTPTKKKETFLYTLHEFKIENRCY